MSQASRLLRQLSDGDQQAASRLLELLYNELRQLARARLAHEPIANTLQPTALVHEAYLRLLDDGDRHFDGKGHFFAAAAEAMRRILIERARRRQAVRHGGGRQQIPLAEDLIIAAAPDEQLLELNDALDRLALQYPRHAELVKLRYFVGLSGEEAAASLQVSPSTADRDWTFARAWLRRELSTGLEKNPQIDDAGES